MADYPYCTVPGKLSELLGKIQQLGIPTKANTTWLPTIGFASKNDRTIIPVLKHVGLINDSNEPTQVWTDFRGAAGGRALGRAVMAAYPELFQTYPDAPNRTTSELEAFFRGHSTYGSQAVKKAVATFKALCQHGEFSQLGNTDSASRNLSDEIPRADERNRKAASLDAANVVDPPSNTPSLHIDIQIHISPEASSDQIEKIFESMSKHLYRNE